MKAAACMKPDLFMGLNHGVVGVPRFVCLPSSALRYTREIMVLNDFLWEIHRTYQMTPSKFVEVKSHRHDI